MTTTTEDFTNKVISDATVKVSALISGKELTTSTVLSLLTTLIQGVEVYKLNGSDKKKIVMAVLRNRAETISNAEDRGAVLLLIDTVVSGMIDTIVAAASGQFSINVRGCCC